MLQYASVFVIIALIAAIFGVGALAVGAGEISEVLFLAFVGLFVGGLVGSLFGRASEWAQEDIESRRASAKSMLRAGRRG